MVRREGTRFGVNTSQSMRRLPRQYQYFYASQSVVVETKLSDRADEVHGTIRKQTKAAVKRQLQRGSFDDRENFVSTGIEYSLNKAKRWEVMEDIKESENHDNHSIVIEHHQLPRPRPGNAPTCVGVFDSTDNVKRLPAKKYARVNDLLRNESKEQSMGEDDDFGKKNRRRSRKGKGVHQEQDEKEEGGHDPLSTVKYDVTMAAPKHTYQTYCNTVGESGRGQRKRNSRNRTGKIAQCSMQDAFSNGRWQLEEDEDYLMDEMEDDELYSQEETMDSTPYQLCTVTMEALINRACTMGSAYKKENDVSACPQRAVVDTKSKVFPVDEQVGIPYFTRPCERPNVTRKIEKQKRRQRRKREKAVEGEKKDEQPAPVPDEFISEKPSVVVSVNTSDIESRSLEGQFGSCYIEGLCMPRRIAINITDSIMDQLQSEGSDLKVASMLQQTGHHIFAVVDCSLESQMMRRDHSILEDVRVKLCGLKEDQELLTSALTGLDSTDLSEVVSALTNSVAQLPLESFLTETSITSVSTKPAFNVETVKSVLGWHYDVTNVNKATEEILADSNKRTEDCSMGEDLVLCEASSECNSCGICFQVFDETFPGTALIGCGHWFCEECWRGHLIARVRQGDTNITCPGFKCTIAVDIVPMMSLLPSSLYARHHANKANIALLLQKDHHWCPSPHCGRLLRLETDTHPLQRANTEGKGSMIPVYCDCGTFWCSECKEEAHWPATCQQAKVYRKEARNTIVNHKYDRIEVNTKPCPRCQYPIEKFYGCNHMRCKCGHDFCWECGQNFSDHYYCTNPLKYRFKKYVIHRDENIAKSAIELAICHGRKRSKFACHSRSRKAQQFALKIASPQTSSTSRDSDDPSSRRTLTPCSTIGTTGVRGSRPCLERARTVLSGVASFLSEAEFVLEHLEILLSKASRSNYRGVLSQHKARLVFITNNLHKIFDEKMKLNMGKIEYQLHCGKSCLKFIAVAATHLTSSMAQATTEE